MDVVQHLNFCPAGTPFFDVPGELHTDEHDFPAVREHPPPGWRTTVGTEWAMVAPPDIDEMLPQQGWKIHVSATPDNAERVLGVVRDYCGRNGVVYKFLRSMPLLHRRNSKYGDRSASGKFITIYPTDDEHFAHILQTLGDALDGEVGPYILSDLRWRSGPLYVRYGGFAQRTVRTPSGEVVHCIEDPDGNLVPDRRGPGFRPPEWVRLPDCLDEAVAARNAGTLDDFPYRVTGALHFSNGGGVYKGVDTRTGADVLLREARPLAGLDGNGRDAVARHEREHWALQRLTGLAGIPPLIDYRKGHEHYFLVREFVEGEALSKQILRRNPLVHGRDGDEEAAAYARWALGLLAEIEGVLGEIHERGVVFGDLHPGNILVREDDTVAFIDFETASAVEEEVPQHMGAVGFTAPAGYTGMAVDRYALGCLRIALFAPLAAAVPWGPEKAEQLLELIAARFPVPADFADRVRDDLGPAPHPVAMADPAPWSQPLWSRHDEADWPAVRKALAEGVLATAAPDRADRLFPGDASQFFTPEGGVNLAHGAAGVLWALDAAAQEVPAEHVDWLVAAAMRLEDSRPGLYSGLAGVACVLDGLGRDDAAAALLARVEAVPAEAIGFDVFDGLAGIGLAYLHFARSRQDERLLAAARDAAGRLVQAPAVPDDPRALGLLRGHAGPAALMLRLYEETGEEELLDGAEQALRRDLSGFGLLGEDEASADAPAPAPLVASGCGGTAVVLHDLLRWRPDPELAEVRDRLRDSSGRAFFSQAGLFHGRAGALLVRLLLSGDTDAAPVDHDDAVRRHVEGFGLHAVQLRDRPAMLGQECLRVSADLATGAAGVLLALTAATAGTRPDIPWLGSASRDGAALV